MHLDYTDEQRALRDELRLYLEDLITDALMAELDATEGGGPLYHEAIERFGADGWLGIGWPREHGGQGRGPIEQFIFFDEVQRAGFPVPILTLNTVGPTLLKFGSQAQIAKYAPAILAGKCHFSIGYTEPDSGTDLASLKTTAIRQGDEYIINGQKIWTSLADHADYIWLAARTNPDPNVPPHKSISILIVPTDAPGFSSTPIHALGENNVHATYYDNVRVPVGNLVDREGAGWKLITSQLNHERVALVTVGPMQQLLEDTMAWAKETSTGSASSPEEKLADLAWVRANLARVHAKLEVLKLLNWRQAFNIAAGTLGPAEASAIKVYGSEFYVEASRLLMEIHGAAGCLHHSSQGALLRGRLEKFYRMSLVLTFGGGTNEVQRDLIGQFGLRLPTAGRR